MRHDEDNTPLKTLAQLKKLVHEKTEEYLHEKYRWESVEKMIDDVLRRRINDIVATALGFRQDSFSRGWELDPHKDSGRVQSTLKTMVRHHAEKVLPSLIKDAEKSMTRMMLSKKSRQYITDTYKEYFDRELRRAVDAWISEKAKADIEEIFQRGSEEFFNEIKLKVPLRMLDNLADVAGDEP